MKKFLLSLLLLAPAAFAAGPLFSIVPVGSLPTTVPPGGTATAEYTVTNNAPYALQGLGLNTLPSSQTPVGVTQNTVGGGVCSNPFSLDPGASCILSLTITANDLQNEVAVGGPEVCFTVDTPSRCSVPTASLQLNVSSTAQLYVANNGNSTASKCNINLSDGTFASCGNSGATGFTGKLSSVAFATSSGQNYAYFGQTTTSPSTNHPPSQCIVETNGSLGACQDITNYPAGADAYSVSFSTATNPTYAYVSDDQLMSPLVRQCTLNASGPSFSTCIDSGATALFGTNFITFQTIAGTEYGYLADDNNNLSQYTILGNGNLNQVHTTVISDPTQVAFAEVSGQTYAYVAQSSPNQVSFCEVDTTGGVNNGRISNCNTTSVGFLFGDPLSIVVGTFLGVNYAYVSDFTADKVWVCPINTSTGDFTGCTDAGGSFNSPWGLALQ